MQIAFVGAVLCLASAVSNASMPGYALSHEEIGQEGERDNLVQNGVVMYKDKWYQAGDTIYGYKNYIKLVVGDANVPLLLGIPHDGVLEGTPEIPLAGSTGRDINTKRFTFAIAQLFKEDTGLQPWIILSEIHRRRVDANTYPSDLEKRYGVDTEARKTYDSYHELLLLARNTMAQNLAQTTGGLFIDMHGHGRRYANGWEEEYVSIINGKHISSRVIVQSEIGYALAISEMEKDDEELDQWAEYSSVYAISKAHHDVPFSQIIRGPYSLGALLDDEGVLAVPGRRLPILERDETRFGKGKDGTPNHRPYFTGGFLTRKYGSAIKTKRLRGIRGFDDNISALQIETPGVTVRNNQTLIDRSSHKFKRAIIRYINYWYGYDFPNSPYPYPYYGHE